MHMHMEMYCMHMEMYFTLIKILVMLYLIVMKWAFLTQTLIILILMINLMKIILLVWYIKFENREELKKELSEELRPVARHPNRWWDWCMSENEKEEIDPMFIEEL